MVIPLLLESGLHLGGEFKSLGHGDNLLSKPHLVPVFWVDAKSTNGANIFRSAWLQNRIRLQYQLLVKSRLSQIHPILSNPARSIQHVNSC